MTKGTTMKVLALFVLVFPTICFGWGAPGHKAVCQIAYVELSPGARAEVDRLIGLDSQYDSFAESCLFADGPPRIQTLDHYINVPRSFRAITTTACPMADTCLFRAVERDSSILADAASSDEDKLFALKLLGHWLGDIHQPLHVSYQDDLGANNILQEGSVENWNLHGAWDFGIIDQQIGTDYLQMAAELRAEISDRDRVDWKFDSPVEWANESYQITISRRVDYCTQKAGACWYERDNMMLNAGEELREVAVTKRYTARHRKTVERRLRQAGVRLAATINTAFDQD